MVRRASEMKLSGTRPIRFTRSLPRASHLLWRKAGNKLVLATYRYPFMTDQLSPVRIGPNLKGLEKPLRLPMTWKNQIALANRYISSIEDSIRNAANAMRAQIRRPAAPPVRVSYGYSCPQTEPFIALYMPTRSDAQSLQEMVRAASEVERVLGHFPV